MLLTEHPGWQVLVRGINQRRSRIIENIATGRQLELHEIRSLQDQLAMLARFAHDPVSWLLEFDKTESGANANVEAVAARDE